MVKKELYGRRVYGGIYRVYILVGSGCENVGIGGMCS